MKKNILLALAFIACYNLQAQKFAAETFLGINAGTTFSRVDFIPTVSQTKLMGYNAGVTFRYITESHFGLQAELNFSQRGWIESMTDPTQSYIRHLNYIELPFLTHVYFGSHSFGYFVNLGPKIAYLINENESGNFTAGVKTEYGKKVEHPLDYSICGGTGFEIQTKVGRFLVEGRYNFGLADIFYNSRVDPFTRSSNQFISANLTYMMKL